MCRLAGLDRVKRSKAEATVVVPVQGIHCDLEIHDSINLLHESLQDRLLQDTSSKRGRAPRTRGEPHTTVDTLSSRLPPAGAIEFVVNRITNHYKAQHLFL